MSKIVSRYGLFILILILALLLRVEFLAEKPLSLDEPHTIAYVDRTFGDMLTYIAREYRMPLYYFIAWNLYAWGGVMLLKIFSVILGVLSVAGVIVLAHLLFGHRTAIIAGLMMALSPVHIAYSQYVREYSLYFLFFTVSMIAFVLCVQRNKKGTWALLAASNALLFLTHFFSLLMIVPQFVSLLMLKTKNKVVLIRNFVIQGVGVLAASLAWLFFLFGNVELLGIGNFVHHFDNNPLRIVYAVYKFSIGVNVSGFLRWGPALLAIAVPFFSALFLLAVRHFLLHDRERGKIIITAFLLPLLLLFAVSVITNDALFIYRYISPALVPFVLLVAAYLSAIKAGRMRILALLLLFGLYAAADLYYYSVITLPDWPARFGI